MAQLYFKDSGLLLQEGNDAAHYQGQDDYDAVVHGIADTGQAFHINWVPKRQVWFYIKDLDVFYESKEGIHAFWAAAADEFTPSRWAEIEDILEESGSVKKALNDLKHAKVVDKATKQFDRGLITNQELNALKKIFK